MATFLASLREASAELQLCAVRTGFHHSEMDLSSGFLGKSPTPESGPCPYMKLRHFLLNSWSHLGKKREFISEHYENHTRQTF